MKALLQCVSRAQVRVDSAVVGAIQAGYLALVGVQRGDSETDLNFISRKIIGLRVWPDASGKRNASLLEDHGRSVLLVSQFTLLGQTRQGMRPDLVEAAPAAEAQPLYEQLIQQLRDAGAVVAAGVFGADMQVELVNEGPATYWIDSRT